MAYQNSFLRRSTNPAVIKAEDELINKRRSFMKTKPPVDAFKAQAAEAEAQIPTKATSIMRPTTNVPRGITDRGLIGGLMSREEMAKETAPQSDAAKDYEARHAMRTRSSARSFMSPRDRDYMDKMEGQGRQDSLLRGRRFENRRITEDAQKHEIDVLDIGNKFTTSEREAGQVYDTETQGIADTHALNLQKEKNVGLIGSARAGTTGDYGITTIKKIDKTGKNQATTREKPIVYDKRTGAIVEQEGAQMTPGDALLEAQATFDEYDEKKSFGYNAGRHRGNDQEAIKAINKSSYNYLVAAGISDASPALVEDMRQDALDGKQTLSEILESYVLARQSQQQ